jgi:hypothetical protein
MPRSSPVGTTAVLLIGAAMRPGRMVVGNIASSCDRYLTWRCECGAVTYGPALAAGRSLLHGPARVRG